MGEGQSLRSPSKYSIVYEASDQSMGDMLVAVGSLAFLTGAFYYVGIIALIALYYAVFHHSLVAIAILAVMVASSFYKTQILWQELIDHWIWQTWCEYFSFKVVNESDGEFRKEENYIFAEFPHGVFPLGFILSATIVQKQIGGIRVEGAIASILFKIPIIRQLSHWFGSREATKKNIHLLLDQGSVGILPGGIAEIFLADRDEERIYLKKRKGFVKIALQRGVNLVPIYYFGNSQLFDFVGGRTISRLSRKMRTSILLFYGRFFLPIPYQHPITMVIGKIIRIPEAIPEPTQKQIDDMHQRFTDELVGLFDRHKEEFGWAHKQLIVL